LIDLAIIGGGPAGTAAALEARRRGLRVALWERATFPQHKVCGEFLSAEALPLLEREIPEALARASVMRRAEFVSPAGRVSSFDLPAPARGLSRWVMDEALWRAACARGALGFEGAAVRAVERRETPTDRPPSWHIDWGARRTAPARALLAACGRWWNVAGLTSPTQSESSRRGLRRRSGVWVGAKAHLGGLEPRDAVEMYFFSGGYCGLAPIEDGLYNACCLVHGTLMHELGGGGAGDFVAWLGRLARHPALAARLRGAVQVSSTVTTAPVHLQRQGPRRDGALAAGDAAGFLDPFTGDGISQALCGGRLAAEVLAEARDHGASLADAAREHRRRLARAVTRSYRVAGLVRLLVRAPAALQSAAAAAVPRLGAHLLAATRWQLGPSV
jgi:flavin-dependent dehydrogenase